MATERADERSIPAPTLGGRCVSAIARDVAGAEPVGSALVLDKLDGALFRATPQTQH